VVKRYLDLVSLERALAVLGEAFRCRPRTERVPLEEASGRVTAAPIFARLSVPAIHISAMDGIAVRSAETRGASESRPVVLTDAVRVNTGNIVPPAYDAVVMIEDVWLGEGTYTIRKAVAPWQHVRPVGEDDRPGLAGAPGVGAPHCDPVHRRDVDGRDREPGKDGGAGHPAGRLVEGHPDRAGAALERLPQDRQRPVQGDQVQVALHHRTTSTSSPVSKPSRSAGTTTMPSLCTSVLRRPDFPKTGVASPSFRRTRT